MKLGAIFRTINKHSTVYVCLTGSFAMSWSAHCRAFKQMRGHGRLSVRVDDLTLENIASVVGWVAANYWLAAVYLFLVVASVAFLQFRRQPPWTHWLAATAFFIPAVAYWAASMYYAALVAQ